MSTQPRRSPRLLAAEWKANAEAYHTRRNASRVPAGPPNTFVSTHPVPDSTPPPRRSTRLAAKIVVKQPVVDSVSSKLSEMTQPTQPTQQRISPEDKKRMTTETCLYLLPVFDILNHIHIINIRAEIILRMMSYINLHSEALIWNPKFRITVYDTCIRIWNQAKDRPDIDEDRKHALHHEFQLLKVKLSTMITHPDYLA
jgi:hypothetical protein